MLLAKAKLIGGGIAILAILATVYAGYRYVTNLQEENAILAANEAKLTTAVDLFKAQTESLQAGIEATAIQLAEANTALTQIREERERRKRIFDDHDFTKLLNAKPGLIERRMVDGTARMFRDLEEASRD